MVSKLGHQTHAVLRISVGVLFIQHGLQKLFGAFGGVGPSGTVPLASMLGFAGLLELVGGTLLIIGLLTRPVAAVLVIEMIAAFLIAHAPKGGWPIQNQGELALLYAAVFAFLATNGAGPLSLDAWLPRLGSANRRQGSADRRRPIAA
jgi:putative oxidoreductase